MILADKIIDLRKKNGWSQEELAEKLDVSRQAVSKWESAQSVPDMSRVVMMSELFGVSTDYLLKDSYESETPASAADGTFDIPARTVGMEEANGFLEVRDLNSRRIALGVMLCVLSPVVLILLGGASDYGKLNVTEAQAVGIGLVFLFALVGTAVALFVTSGLRGARYEYLEKENVDTLYGVDGMVRERREKYRPTYVRQLTVGIVLCVASAVPIFISLILAGDDSFLNIAAVGALLVMVAVGTLLIVRTAIVWDGFRMLLSEGDYSREAKVEAGQHGSFGRIYWGLVTAGYLAWSFITNDWPRSWIVWPIAGAAYGAIFAIMRALRKNS